MQIQIINGIYTNEDAELRTAYPRNLMPVPKQSGISKGYLRPADGVVQIGTGPGIDRGSINWGDVCYRVMGSKLVSVASDGTVTIIGDVGGTVSQVSLDYSFDYLAVASDSLMYLYNGITLTQITDADLGVVVDFIYIDGYFLTTDGTNLVVTELGDPFSVNPLKYGSSEIDPDPIKAILDVGNEPYVMNRYTIEVFENVGGSVFPFQRIEGANISRGTIGTHSCAVYMESVAYLGGGRNEAPAVWMSVSGNTAKISTSEVDQLLLGYTTAQLESVVFEVQVEKGFNHLHIRLPDKTLVYDFPASQVIQRPVWFVLTSGVGNGSQCLISNRCRCYDKWIVGNPQSFAVGELTNEVSTHWGDAVSWEFNTQILYAEGRKGIIHELELVGLTGRVTLGDDPRIYTQYSTDGETWSVRKYRSAGKIGERNKRLTWLQQGPIEHWRIQQFGGTSDAFLSFMRLEAQIEALK